MVAPDGTISLMDVSSKKIIWSFASGPSIYSLYQALPDHEGDNGSFFIDLGQDDWELYMHVNDSTAVVLHCNIFACTNELVFDLHKVNVYTVQ